MKILQWNILHGGGPKRTPEIALALVSHAPDVVVLTEFRRTTGGQIAGVLHDRGLIHQADSDPAPGRNGILIAASEPLGEPRSPSSAPVRARLITCRLETSGIRLAAAHVPDARRSDAESLARKSLFWNELLSLARDWCEEPALLLGDLNTGRPGLDEDARTLTSPALLGKLTALGWADSYRLLHPRGRDRSWYSHTGSGFRLDHALVSRPLGARVHAAWYSSEERVNGLSDHAPMVLELDPIGGPAGAIGRIA